MSAFARNEIDQLVRHRVHETNYRRAGELGISLKFHVLAAPRAVTHWNHSVHADTLSPGPAIQLTDEGQCVVCPWAPVGDNEAGVGDVGKMLLRKSALPFCPGCGIATSGAIIEARASCHGSVSVSVLAAMLSPELAEVRVLK
jgi:hypothetical protein